MPSAPACLIFSIFSQNSFSLITECREHHPSVASGRIVGARIPGKNLVMLSTALVVQLSKMYLLFFATCTDFVALERDMPTLEKRVGEIAVPVGVLFGTADRVLDCELDGASMPGRLPSVDFERLELRRSGAVVDLPPRAIDILKVLAREDGRVVSRDQLLDEVWGRDQVLNSRTVDNLVVRLRQAIERDPEAPRHLVTVHGRGYRLVTRS